MKRSRAKSSRSRRAASHGPVEYRFEIDVFTPETIPMGRLAEYMADLAGILGQREHVHFRRLDKGSAVVVHTVDWEAVPKVRNRVHAIKRSEAPAEVIRLADSLNRRLADDNASARLIGPHDKVVIKFPGREGKEEPEFAISQPGDLYGTVIVVGGTSDPVPVHIEDERRVHLCEAPRALAKELARYIFGGTLAVSGLGRWARESDGEWRMRSFRIQSFRPLDDRPLTEVVEELRRTPADWTRRADPIGDLRRIRKLQ